jgi:hypothetical protein
MKKKVQTSTRRPEKLSRRQRAERLVDKLISVDDLKKASGWGPACRACCYRTPY